MTPQEIIREFRAYSTVEQVALMSRLFSVIREAMDNGNENDKLEQAEKIVAVERLRGIAKTENPPITKEEVREDYHNYLAEKYL